MSFQTVEALFSRYRELGAVRVVAKFLAENDNSKQQIYLGGSFEVLKLLAYESVEATPGGKRPNFKAKMRLSWIGPDAQTAPAPGSQLILYPDYPEVRLSGFLRGCTTAPAHLLRPVPPGQRRFNNGPDGRVLFIGVTADGTNIAFLAEEGSPLAVQAISMRARGELEQQGALWMCMLHKEADPRELLLAKLREIRDAGWHPSMRLNRKGERIPYAALNGGGYTLEALFGIVPNGRSEPDYMGWELKAYGSDRITLMTPEPDAGFYAEHGAEAFVRRYGKDVGDDTLYFTGLHRVGERCRSSGQTLTLRGYDPSKAKLVDVAGGIELLDADGTVSAAWTYGGLIDHWGRKHASAAYVPYESRKGPPPAYHYRDPVLLGERTDFSRYLGALHAGKVVYDPATKVTDASAKSKVKARSQFRIQVRQLAVLYEKLIAVSL